MSYSFVRLYLSKCDVRVLNLIWINPKRFLIILYVFGSNFYHFLCSCLVFTLFFIVLPCFVLKNRCQCFSRLSWRLASRETPVVSSSRSFWRLTRGLLATHSRLAKIFATETRDSPSREMPRNSFLKGFLWETYFKPLPSSLKPLFQYFYIKTQPI